MKIWTVTTSQEDDGTATAVFANEADAMAQYARIVAASWEGWFGDTKGPMPEDTDEAWDILTSQVGFLDGVTVKEHDVASPISADVAARVAHLRHVYGAAYPDAALIEGLARDRDQWIEAKEAVERDVDREWKRANAAEVALKEAAAALQLARQHIERGDVISKIDAALAAMKGGE